MTKPLKNLVIADLRKAISELSHGDPNRGIHEARRSLKRCRAALYLFREQMTPLAFDQLRSKWSGIARRLSDYRDGYVVRRVFDRLAMGEYPEVGAELKKKLRASGRAKVVAVVVSELGDELKWAKSELPREASDEEIRRAIARARKAVIKSLARAEKTQRPEDLHEFRKKLNRLRHELRLIGTPEEKLDRIVNLLGRANDLHRLEFELEEIEGTGEVRHLASARIKELGEKAIIEYRKVFR